MARGFARLDARILARHGAEDIARAVTRDVRAMPDRMRADIAHERGGF